MAKPTEDHGQSAIYREQHVKNQMGVIICYSTSLQLKLSQHTRLRINSLRHCYASIYIFNSELQLTSAVTLVS